jgi:cytochrome c oxidase subunit 1
MKSETCDSTPEPIGADASLSRDLATWFSTLDTALLARRHLLLAVVYLVLGLVSALWLRRELVTPPLDGMDAATFGALLSMHGALMMYFVVLPLFPGALAPALIARFTGREGNAFPRLVRLSWHLLALGGLVLVLGFIRGGTEAGWSFDAEFGGRFEHGGIGALAAGALLAAGSMILLAVNLLVTLFLGRATAIRSISGNAALAAWTGGGITGLVAGGFLAACAILVLADRFLGISFFCSQAGCNPQDFARLFRFFATPAQSLVLLFSLGTLIVLASNRPWPASLAGRLLPALLVFATVAGLWAWPSPTSGGASTVSPAMSGVTILSGPVFLVALVVVLVCLRNFWRGRAGFDAVSAYTLAGLLLGLQALGCGLLLAPPFGGAYLSGTLFASAQMHLLMVGLPGLVFLAGLHDVWPRLTGRTFRRGLGCASAAVILLGAQAAFLPLLLMGLAGAPFRSNAYDPAFQTPQVLATAGSTVLVVGLVLALFNLATGKKTPENLT